MLKTKRNYGIDLLRFLSMFFVLILHSLGDGGLLKGTVFGSVHFKTVWFMEIGAYAAVNIFGLISGYVMYKQKEHKIANYIKLWLTCVIYLLLIRIFKENVRDFKSIVMVFMPITNKFFWYLNAYTGLFLFIPFINKGLSKLTIKDCKIIFVLILLFVTFGFITDAFQLCDGYSFIWLVILYVLGAIIHKAKIFKNISTKYFVLCIILFWLFSYLYFRFGFNFYVLRKKMFVSYISPTILGMAICYLIIFSRIKVNNFFKKIAVFITPSVFSIYILNYFFLYDRFQYLRNSNPLRIILTILIFDFIFAFIIIAIDKIRLYLFELLRINKLAKNIEKRILKFAN